MRDHMKENVLTLKPTMTLKEAAKLMDAKRITGAPVTSVEGGRLVGVLSRTDILRMIACVPKDLLDKADANHVSRLKSIESTEVRLAMSPNPVTIAPNATILEAAQMMHQKRLNRLMVADEGGALVGTISSSDVVRVALCDEITEVDYGDVEA